jgi:uncharacterized protein (UPF0262 family)
VTAPPPERLPRDPARRLAAVTLDELSLGAEDREIAHERRVAIADLLESNHFALPGHDDDGPYRLHIGLAHGRLALAVRDERDRDIVVHLLSLRPFRRLVRDYFLICESYYAALRTATPDQIEAIDHGRRGVHDEGSQLLAERLAGKIEVDFDTARRLFTLIAVLHWKGSGR